MNEKGEADCELRKLYDRDRKTGPCHPLAVLRCRRHGEAFTLYPLPFGPYLRLPVERVSPDGAAVLGEPSETATDPVRRGFNATIFGAALDAADGKAWARNSLKVVPEQWWGVQGRRLAEAARMVGIAPDQSDSEREVFAQVLGVDGLLLREKAQAARTGGGYRGLGQAVKAVLDALKATASRALRLLTCGHLTGRWGRPLAWDPQRRCLWSLPFPPPGTAPPS